MKTVLTFVLLFVVAMHQSSAVAGGFREGTLYPGSDFDLETGHSTQKGQNPAAKHDLTWGCGPNEVEFLRALTGVTWAVPAKKSFDVGLSTMKQASFYAPIDGTGYPNLFRVPANAMQQLVGTVYYVATAEGNLARLRIVGCDPPVKKPMICRNVKIEYEVFIADGAWGSCTWAEVGSQKSHQAGSAWCPPGSLITQFDLDGDSTVSGTDAPIVGRARCCTHTKLLT